LPALDLDNFPSLVFYEHEANWASAGEHHYIMASTGSQTDPDDFFVVADMTPANHTIGGFDGAPTLIDLSSLAGQTNVYLAFRYTGDFADTWYLDDVQVTSSDFAHDVKTASCLPNGQQYQAGDSFIPRAVVENVGTNTESFDVRMEIFETGTLVYTETASVSNLIQGQTTVVSFPTFAAINDGNLYTLAGTTLLVGDMAPANDTGYGYDNSYTKTRVPVGMFFTNAGCPPCATANPILDAYMDTQDDEVALIRVHVWWPGSDGIYNANTVQSHELTEDYGVNAVPDMWIDGTINTSAYASTFNARKLVRCPTTISAVFDPANEEMFVTVVNHEPIPPGTDFRLKVAITEDDVYYNGSNGEPIHHQAFRRMYPSTAGIPVPSAEGTYQFTIACDLQPAPVWNYSNLRTSIYIRDEANRQMHQAFTDHLSDIEYDPTPVGGEVALPFRLEGNYPNPFNPTTKISFSLPRQQRVVLSIYAVDGSRVATLVDEVKPAGRHEVVWDGRGASGAPAASGSYFYRMEAGEFSATERMMLIK